MRQLKLFGAAIVFFIVAILSPLGSARAQTPDPTTVAWDVNISGAVRGLGILQFYADGNLGGIVLVRPTRNVKPANTPDPVLFGFTPIVGEWAFDGNRIVGFFIGGSEESPLNMSFQGSVKTGLSISLTAKGNDGTWKLKGIAAESTAAAFDGTAWTAKLIENNTDKFTEFFGLSALDMCLDEILPANPLDCVDVLSGYFYALEGSGPGYLTEGYVLVSPTGRIGLDLIEDSGDGRAVTGTYKNGKTSVMLGANDDNENVSMSAASPELLP